MIKWPWTKQEQRLKTLPGWSYEEDRLIYYVIQGLVREYPICCVMQWSYERVRGIRGTKRPIVVNAPYSVRTAEHLDLYLGDMLRPDPYELCSKCTEIGNEGLLG